MNKKNANSKTPSVSLSELFAQTAKVLSAVIEHACSIPHAGVKRASREEILRIFLNNHLPRLNIPKGSEMPMSTIGRAKELQTQWMSCNW